LKIEVERIYKLNGKGQDAKMLSELYNFILSNKSRRKSSSHYISSILLSAINNDNETEFIDEK